MTYRYVELYHLAVRLKIYAIGIVLAKIFKATTSIFLGFMLLSSSISVGAIKTAALDPPIPIEANGDDPMQIVVKPTQSGLDVVPKDKKELIVEKNINDLLGEELIFPFNP